MATMAASPYALSGWSVKEALDMVFPAMQSTSASRFSPQDSPPARPSALVTLGAGGHRAQGPRAGREVEDLQAGALHALGDEGRNVEPALQREDLLAAHVRARMLGHEQRAAVGVRLD